MIKKKKLHGIFKICFKEVFIIVRLSVISAFTFLSVSKHSAVFVELVQKFLISQLKSFTSFSCIQVHSLSKAAEETNQCSEPFTLINTLKWKSQLENLLGVSENSNRCFSYIQTDELEKQNHFKRFLNGTYTADTN